MNFDFGIKDIIDITLVAILFYQLYKLFKGTGVNTIFYGILILVIVWFFVVYVFQLELLGAILNKVMSVGIIALIIIFQVEIRRFFSMIGSHQRWRFFKRLFARFNMHETSEESDSVAVAQLVMACRHMAKSRTGALIVVAGKTHLESQIQVGEPIDADINTRLIENIFFKNSPLHDGAMIIENRKITYVASILPLSQSHFIPKHVGLRHRAAVGITEQTDALAIIVSEEKGSISLSQHGDLKLNVSPDELQNILSEGYL
jgi:uncharacterized protein (TIGR00159 family)